MMKPDPSIGVILALLVASMSWAAWSAGATVPATMSYQGLLASHGEIPPDDDYGFTFRIYSAPTGGTALWEESQTVAVTGGLFDVVLGLVDPLALPFDVPYWLETEVAGESLTPRVPLTAAPYAQRAAVAESLVGGSGDITAVYADEGLAGGAESGDAHLSVGAGEGIEVLADEIRLAPPYGEGSAYDERFVNEAQPDDGLGMPPRRRGSDGFLHRIESQRHQSAQDHQRSDARLRGGGPVQGRMGRILVVR